MSIKFLVSNYDAIRVDYASKLPLMKMPNVDLLKSENLINLKCVCEALPLKWEGVVDEKTTCLVV